MPHVITEPCIAKKDGSCVDVCPVDCIHPRKDSPKFGEIRQLYIDPDTCIDCGLCIDECPVKAIFTEDDVPPKWKQYIQINAEYFNASRPKAKDPVRAGSRKVKIPTIAFAFEGSVYSPFSGLPTDAEDGVNESDPTLLFAHWGDAGLYGYISERVKAVLGDGAEDLAPIKLASKLGIDGLVLFEVDTGSNGVNTYGFAPAEGKIEEE